MSQPILTNADLDKIKSDRQPGGRRVQTATIDTTWPAAEGAEGMQRAVERICREATDAVLADHNILILSDRGVGPHRIPVPALLATAAVHHHLIRQGLRDQVGLVVESGEPREVHHFCVLAGYGAEAINPYLAFDTLEQLRVQNGLPLKAYEVQKNYIKAVGKGILKVISKMGISTYQSYCGAQIFDAVGLSSQLGGAMLHRHRDARSKASASWSSRRRRCSGTRTPMTATRSTRTCWMSAATTRSDCAARRMRGRRIRSASCNMRCAATASPRSASSPRRSTTRASRHLTIRGLMHLRSAETPVPLEEVEAAHPAS